MYRSAQFLDCRIRAYSENATIPSLPLVDHDREHFKTHEELELEVVKTGTNFEKILGGSPTIMWTGNGYHTIQPYSVVVRRVSC